MTDQFILTPTEAAELLNISENVLARQSQPNGPIPCVRLGGKRRYSPRRLAEFVDQKGIDDEQR